MRVKSWSLAREIGTVESVVRGAVDLADELMEVNTDALAVAYGAESLVAILSLLERRLHDLNRILSGDTVIDIAGYIERFHSPHNARDLEGADDVTVCKGGDVIFVPSARPKSR